jgi:signal transduction histidine kinase
MDFDWGIMERPMENPDTINILVVDDLPEKLLVYRTILEELGHNLVTAHSGADALKQVLQTNFAVILLDVNMPGMDGFETATLIRNRRKSAHTPIIFVTAFQDDLRPIQGYAHGAVDYILAPVAPEILRAKVTVFADLFRMHQLVKRQAEERIALAEERAKRAAAEDANRRKDEFLAMLAHELRNPLAPIRTGIEVMRQIGLADPKLQRTREMIDRQLRQLNRLVDDLLDVSRITRGKIQLQLDTLDVATAVAGAVETSRPLIESRKHELNLCLPGESIYVEADPVRLAQVLSNLLNNAAKYTEEGGHIWLSVEQQGGEAVFRVRDTGAGIPYDMLPRVFDLFLQVDQSLDRSQGGLGIGLTLVRRLVEMHQGSVQAFSQGPGQGSEFVVRLPVLSNGQPRAAAADGAVLTPVPAEKAEGSHAHPVKPINSPAPGQFLNSSQVLK